MERQIETRFIAGEELHAALQVEKQRRVPAGRYEGTYESSSLCSWQLEVANRGIVAVHLVKSIYGWTVRYDSGIQNFGIVASARYLGGTYEAAVEFARKWVAEDPARRYAYVRGFDLDKQINEA